MARDTQRLKCYRWERAVEAQLKVGMYVESMTLDEVKAFVKRIWRAERGRYGKANHRAPEVLDGRGRRRACGSPSDLRLPRWSRNPWVVLHELAHGLIHDRGPRGWHGPRFVGCLIGLVARHMRLDADYLLTLAEIGGVKVYTGSIGAVPQYSWARRVEKHLPGTDIEIAIALSGELGEIVNSRTVRGAALQLIRQGKARWRGKTLVRKEVS